MTGKIINPDELVVEAIRVVDPIGPKRLLSALLGMPDPFKCGDQAVQKVLNEAIEIDFGPDCLHRQSGKQIDESNRRIWVDRIAWLLGSMQEIKNVHTNAAVLRAMLLTSSAFRAYGDVWSAVPRGYYTVDLLDSMSALVATARYPLDIRLQQVSICGRNAIDEFLQAEHKGDWSAIASSWDLVVSEVNAKYHLSDGVALVEAVACLNATKLGQKSLAAAIDKMEGILSIRAVFSTMSLSQIVNVALYSVSNRTRFVLIPILASWDIREPIGENTIKILVTVFSALQRDPDEWTKWMRAFNWHLKPAAGIQRALGASLVNSNESVKSAFVNAINLKAINLIFDFQDDVDSRDPVNKCLEEFQKHATPIEQQSMWRLSYLKWNKWNFDQANDTRPLIGIVGCDLDFAIIGYFADCLSHTELNEELGRIRKALSNCLDKWHKNQSSYNDDCLRLLSRYQLAIYANTVRNGERPWILPRTFNHEINRYDSMTYLPRYLDKLILQLQCLN